MKFSILCIKVGYGLPIMSTEAQDIASQSSANRVARDTTVMARQTQLSIPRAMCGGGNS